MSSIAEQILERAMTLSPAERVPAAEELLRSVESPQQAEIDTEWEAEIERRIEELDAGKVQTRPAREVIAELRGRLPGRRIEGQ